MEVLSNVSGVTELEDGAECEQHEMLAPPLQSAFCVPHCIKNKKKKEPSLLLKLSVPVCLLAVVVMEKTQKCLAREDASAA